MCVCVYVCVCVCVCDDDDCGSFASALFWREISKKSGPGLDVLIIVFVDKSGLKVCECVRVGLYVCMCVCMCVCFVCVFGVY